MMLTPFGSMIVGFLAGIISVLGFKYLSVRMTYIFILSGNIREFIEHMRGRAVGHKLDPETYSTSQGFGYHV